MDGYDVCRAALSVACVGAGVACSSAGGGLRLAVVGYERAITAEAGYRVALSAGARVVHVASDRLDDAAVAALLEDRPGRRAARRWDGRWQRGDPAPQRAKAGAVGCEGAGRGRGQRRRARRGRRGAARPEQEGGGDGQRAARDRPARSPPGAALQSGTSSSTTSSAASVCRARPEFAAMVRAATPDAVLAGVELLADGAGDVAGVGDVLVVDVGGATTDVYSVVTPVGEDADAAPRRGRGDVAQPHGRG